MSGEGGPVDLAATLAARLCHDFIGPAGAVVQGLELLAASPADDLRVAAMTMIDTAGREALARIAFARMAFGSGDEAFAAGDLEALARGLFENGRASLDWTVAAPVLTGPAARVLLNLVEIGADALALGGMARVQAEIRQGVARLTVEAVGARAILHPDVVAGLAGGPRGAGPGRRWIQARFVHALVGANGGEAAARREDSGIVLTASLP